MNIKALIKSILLRKFSVGLLILQLALTFGLIVNSAILAFDTMEKLNTPMGIDLENTLVVELSPTSGEFRKADYAKSIIQEDMHHIAQMPGVNAVAPITQLPIQSGGNNGDFHDVNDPTLVEKDRYLIYVPLFPSTPALQNVLDFKVVEGRLLNDSDILNTGGKGMNIVITESLKKAVYGDKSAIGQESNRGTIVGVVADINISPTKPKNKQFGVFMPYTSEYSHYYLLRIAPDQVTQVQKNIEEVILNVQAERDITGIYSMAEHLSNFYGQDQGLAQLFSMLCVLMLLVTVISSYANAQFHMSKQKRLIGIRRALGATQTDVLLYVLGENWLIYSLGSLFGVIAIMAINLLLSQQISLSKPDILLIGASIFIVFLVGTIATWLPAYRTSKIPPVIATRTI